MKVIALRKTLPLIAASLGMLLTVISFFPGYMSVDSFDQLAQARSGIYSSWHPPIMAWVWSFFDKIHPGPLGMFLFFAGMFWVGLGLFVSCGIKNPWLSAGTILAVGLFPSVLGLLGTVWKDVGMGVSLVLSAGLIAFASEKKKIYPLILSLPFLFFAFCVRHESGIAVIPLIVWAGVVWSKIKFSNKAARPVVFVFFGVVFPLAFLGLKTLLDHSLLHKVSPASPIQITWIHDLVGLSLRSKEIILPPYLMAENPELHLEDLRKIYDPTSSLPLFKDDGSYKRFPVAKTEGEFSSLQKYWRQAVLGEPWLYLDNRWILFRSSLSIDKEIVFFPFLKRMSSNSLGITHREGDFNSFIMRQLEKVRNSWVFRGWVYLVFGLAFFIMGITIRSLEISMISLSGLLYEGVHFFTLSACDFRYHWWTVLSVFLCLIILISKIFDRLANRSSMLSSNP